MCRSFCRDFLPYRISGRRVLVSWSCFWKLLMVANPLMQFEPRQHLWRPWLATTTRALDESVAGSLMPLKFDKLWSCRDARTQVDWMKLLFDLYIWPLWFLCSYFRLPLCPNQEPAKAATHKVFRNGSPKDWGEPGPTVGWCLNSLSFSNAILHIIGFLWSSPLKASMRSFIIKMGWLEREEKIGNLCKYQDRYLNQAKLFSSYEYNTCILDFTSKENGFEPPEMPPASPASKLGLDHPLFGVLVKKKGVVSWKQISAKNQNVLANAAQRTATVQRLQRSAK